MRWCGHCDAPGPEGKRLGDVTLASLLEQARPAGTAAFQTAATFAGTWPDEHYAHLEENFTSIVAPATVVAFSTAFGGFMLATVMYCWGWVDPSEVKRQFAGGHRFLTNKWWFDELYEIIFIKPTHWISGVISGFDKSCIDWFLNQLAWADSHILGSWRANCGPDGRRWIREQICQLHLQHWRQAARSSDW